MVVWHLRFQIPEIFFLKAFWTYKCCKSLAKQFFQLKSESDEEK